MVVVGALTIIVPKRDNKINENPTDTNLPTNKNPIYQSLCPIR